MSGVGGGGGDEGVRVGGWGGRVGVGVGVSVGGGAGVSVGGSSGWTARACAAGTLLGDVSCPVVVAAGSGGVLMDKWSEAP